jgi:hypothetical protein
MAYVIPPPDWRDWLGGMALLNVLGLLIYRVVRKRIIGSSHEAKDHNAWRLNEQKLLAVAGATLLVTGLLQAWAYWRTGGILGYVLVYTERGEAFQGMGWIFMISESFPIVALIGFAVYARKRGIGTSLPAISSVLLVFLVLTLLFGGLRGGRANTVWGIFWAVGIIHLWIRPIPKKVIAVGILFLLSFMYLYGFYKSFGIDTLAALNQTDQLTTLTDETGRTLEATILGDLARSDVQAFLLYRFSTQTDDVKYGLGRTYLGALSLLIPRSVWPDRPPHKVKEGTEALHGRGSYVPGKLQSSRVYGLAGEAMLNFGPVAAPLAFALLGLVVGRLHRLHLTLRPDDPRLLLYPFLVNFSFAMMVGDSDNLLFLLIKNGAVPMLIVAISCVPDRSTTAVVRARPKVSSAEAALQGLPSATTGSTGSAATK